MKLRKGASALVVGGTSGVGHFLARVMAEAGVDVFLAGRDAERAKAAAHAIGPGVRGIALDLGEPDSINSALASLPQLDYVVLAAMERDRNHVSTYDHKAALRTVMVKMIGTPEVLHALGDRLRPESSVLLFGGVAYERPAAGSLSTATIGAGVIGLARSLAVQLAPVRVNVLHPGVIGDSPAMMSVAGDTTSAAIARTPIGRLVSTEEIADAAVFLLANTGVNGASLIVDGGWLLA